MAILKQIAGHTSSVPVHRYLERKMRAIAKELYNFDEWDERDSEGRDQAERDAIQWGAEMDALRHSCGNDTPWHGSPARTYKHFVISPAPEDRVSLDDLKGLARDWALKHYPDHQIAIVFHDDNANHIPHAHVVVNNTNLATGRRMHDDDALELNRSLQRLARERGLTAFTAQEPSSGYQRLSRKRGETMSKGRTGQRAMRSRAEAELLRKGQYSWVADIRDRVTVARSLANSEAEFLGLLSSLGVDVSESTARSASHDWIFALADQPTRRVSAGKLGASFGREALQRSLSRRSLPVSGRASAEELWQRAASAIELKDLKALHILADAMDVACKYRLDSVDTCEKAMGRLCARAKGAQSPSERKRIDRQIAALDAASRTLRKTGILPDRAPTTKGRNARRAQSGGWAAKDAKTQQGARSRTQQRTREERLR